MNIEPQLGWKSRRLNIKTTIGMPAKSPKIFIEAFPEKSRPGTTNEKSKKPLSEGLF